MQRVNFLNISIKVMIEIITILHQIVNAEKVIKTLVRIEVSLEDIRIVQLMGLPIQKWIW